MSVFWLKSNKSDKCIVFYLKKIVNFALNILYFVIHIYNNMYI